MESNCEIVKKIELGDNQSCLKDMYKQKTVTNQSVFTCLDPRSFPMVSFVAAASCFVGIQGDSTNNLYKNTEKIIISSEYQEDCLQNIPSKCSFLDNLQFTDHFNVRIIKEIQDHPNYYANKSELAIDEIIRVYNKLNSIEFESIDMEVSPNGSVIFEIKLKNSETLLIVNKPIDKLNDDTVVLTVMQNKEHLFTNLKSLEEVISGSEILTSA